MRCLWIYNSTKHFIVRQCYFANTGLNEYDIGIALAHVENGEIYGNIFEYAKTGVFISYGCSNISIYRNYMRGTKLDIGTIRAFRASYAVNCSFTQNVIHNYGSLTTTIGCSNIQINGNFMNNTEYDEYPNKVIRIQDSEQIQFRENIFTDNYKWFDFDVDQVDCANNTIVGNSIINDLSGIEFPTPLSVSPPSLLHTAQSSSTIMGLTSTTNSQVVNNHIYQPGGFIPGFEPFLLLSVIGAMGVVLTLIVIKKRIKYN